MPDLESTRRPSDVGTYEATPLGAYLEKCQALLAQRGKIINNKKHVEIGQKSDIFRMTLQMHANSKLLNQKICLSIDFRNFNLQSDHEL